MADEKPEASAGMEIGNEDVGGGDRIMVAKLVSAEKGKTKMGDPTLWLEFETSKGNKFRQSYPFARGTQGKLGQLLKHARKVLELPDDANVNLNKLIEHGWMQWKRIEVTFQADKESDEVTYWYLIPISFDAEAPVPKEEEKGTPKEPSEKERVKGILIEALKGGLDKAEVYTVGKKAGMTEADIDMFMIRNQKTHLDKREGKYFWKE